MSAALLNLPIPPAAEDQPAWYPILARVAADPSQDSGVRAAALAATADHDYRSARLAELGVYLADASSAAMRHAAEHEECPPLCEW